MSIPILDTHQHLWDLNLFRLPWLKPESRLAKSHVMSDYLREVDGLGVAKTLYMEVDLDEAQQPEEAEYVIDLCSRPDNPMAGAIIGCQPASPGFSAYCERFTGNDYVRGFRQCIHGDSTPPGLCLQPAFIDSVRRIGQTGRTYDICIRTAEIPDAAALADACPDTQLILDHCGNADVQSTDLSQWQDDIRDIARRPNVACKISGIVVTAKPYEWRPADLAPVVEHCFECFGPDRILFGGDWPVCTIASTLRSWILALQEIVAGWSEVEQRKLFSENGARVYGVS